MADRATRQAFPRAARLTEAIVRGARSLGVLVYSGTGNADGVNGDTILLGPPFVVTDEEMVRIVAGLGDAVEEAVAALAPEVVGARDAAARTPATN